MFVSPSKKYNVQVLYGVIVYYMYIDVLLDENAYY